MDKFDLDIFGLRFRLKLKDDANRYLFVEKLNEPRNRWYLTVPLSPLRKGPDAGYSRPHLTRGRGKKKERRALDAESLAPFPVAGADWPGALKLKFDDVLRLVEQLAPMQAELDALVHYNEYEYTDAEIRQLVVAVYEPNQEELSAVHRDLWERVEEDGRIVIDESTIGTLPGAEAVSAATWATADRLDALAPGTKEAPIRVRIRGACGHEFSTSIYRRDDETWVERRFCCSGDEKQRAEVINRYLHPAVRDAYVAITMLLGFAPEPEGS